MKQTPLIQVHRAAQAKLVDFAGWEMPIQYSGVLDEYHTVRSKAGLFDVSHMGRITVNGGGALAFLQHVTTNDLSRLSPGQSQYSMICTPEGGIKDDVFVYHVKPSEYLVCVNASNREKIVAWLTQQVAGTPGLEIKDRSAELAQIAVQGPASRDILAATGISNIAGLKLRHCMETAAFGESLVAGRTGYTGELGYELYLPAHLATEVWEKLMEAGRAAGIKPAGLGARDLLRLEMAYLLYGNDIDEETTPLEAAAEWVVSFEKGDFIGRTKLIEQRARGVPRRLVGFELVEKAVPRHGFTIHRTEISQAPVGQVTSGNLSPLLQKGIGLGYLPPALAAPGTAITIDIRGKACAAVVTKPPFYKGKKS
jgi:aminomethyltransferase